MREYILIVYLLLSSLYNKMTKQNKKLSSQNSRVKQKQKKNDLV